MTTIDKPEGAASGTEERRKLAELEHLEGFQFRLRFGTVPGELITDESPPLGRDAGPEPSRLLAAAVGNCLSASLLFCLQKSRIAVKHLETKSEAVITRSETKRLRVSRIEVRIQIVLEEDAASAARCMSLFEDYCTVTASIRGAIPVSVAVVTREGETLYERRD